MVVLLLIFAVLLAIISWLLFARIVIDIDTTIYRYEIRWWGLIRTSWHPDRNGLPFRIKVPWYRWEKTLPVLLIPSPEGKPAEPNDDPVPEIKKKSTKRWRPRPTWLLRKLRRGLRSFRVRNFSLRINTQNAYYNGLLYPLNYVFPGLNHHARVDFREDSLLKFWAENRLIRLIYYLIT